MKIALITDTHFGVRNDSQIFQKYFDMFLENVFFPELDKRNIKTLIHLGDLVDRRKYINYVTLNSVRRNFISSSVIWELILILLLEIMIHTIKTPMK